jgi:hypothetical protein
MSYKVYIEMPLGNISEPHDFEELFDANKLFASFVQQMRPWKNFQADVVLAQSGKVLQREKIFNA